MGLEPGWLDSSTRKRRGRAGQKGWGTRPHQPTDFVGTRLMPDSTEDQIGSADAEQGQNHDAAPGSGVVHDQLHGHPR